MNFPDPSISKKKSRFALIIKCQFGWTQDFRWTALQMLYWLLASKVPNGKSAINLNPFLCRLLLFSKSLYGFLIITSIPNFTKMCKPIFTNYTTISSLKSFSSGKFSSMTSLLMFSLLSISGNPINWMLELLNLSFQPFFTDHLLGDCYCTL